MQGQLCNHCKVPESAYGISCVVILQNQKEYQGRTISMMLTYLAATFVVAAEMMKVTMARQSGMEIWKNLSPVLSACQAFASVVMIPRT